MSTVLDLRSIENTGERMWRQAAEKLFMEEWPKLEKEFTTLSRKVFIAGMTSEDVLQEFQIEVFKAAQSWDGLDAKNGVPRSKFRTYAWNLVLRKRADLMAYYFAQLRDVSKEAALMPEHTEELVDYPRLQKQGVGNCSRFRPILDLEGIDHLDKVVLFCRAVGHSIIETVGQINKDIDPEFGTEDYYKRIRKLKKNPAVVQILQSI